MSTKKDTTPKGRKGTQGRSQAQDKSISVTVKFPFGIDQTTLPAHIRKWTRDGEVYARILASPDCPQSFRQAFTAIMNDYLVNKCEAAHPSHVAAFFPLVLICLQGWCPADAETTAEILVTLRETLAPDLTEKVLAEFPMK